MRPNRTQPPIQIGLHLSTFDWPAGPARLGPTLTAVAAAADQGGFRTSSVMDHLWQLDWYGKPEDEMLKAHTTLDYLAGYTERVELLAWGSAVVYREPVCWSRPSRPSTSSPAGTPG